MRDNSILIKHKQTNLEPVWRPTEAIILQSNIYACMQQQGFDDYYDFQQWASQQSNTFWEMMLQKLHIVCKQPYQQINASNDAEHPQWLSGARLNIVDSCFQANADNIAIISHDDANHETRWTYHQLEQYTNRIANSLIAQGLQKNDSVAIIMPMTAMSVAIYLGIVKAGMLVVGIPDSFSSNEIAIRLKISNTKLIFTQDHILRTEKKLPLYQRVRAANNDTRIIVLPCSNNTDIKINNLDSHWHDFLNNNTAFTSLSCLPDETSNILFSSGTTGEPKAIPWNHTTPIKCGSDAYLHMDIKAGDVLAWPTNLGWMMGPWLIYAALLNKATIALYQGAPTDKQFGQFVQDAKVTMLGVVPTIVNNWHHSGLMEAFNWDSIKLFASTAECSNPDDMRYLMRLAHDKPIIEYCGGTEIGGAYITSTLLQANIPSCFTTPALGLDFMLLDENGKQTDNGEVALIPPSIGLSNKLLNRDHHQEYYANMPSGHGLLRRHGDQIQCLQNHYYKAQGRADDTMKLGGIKVSSAEIERCLNSLNEISESAAIAVAPADGGPHQLVVYVVIENDSFDAETLKQAMQQQLKQQLNPLFKLHDIVVTDNLPRTASNKIMRRVLRDRYQHKIK